MIALRPMHPAEFAGYLGYFVPDYAAELVQSHGLAPDAATSRSRQEIAADLPDGVATSGNDLLCITGGTETLGYLWLRPDPDDGSAFIMDFHILPAQQGKGLGRAAIAALEAHLAAQGITRLRLRVAPGNARALHLYEASGFRITGYNMEKAVTRY